MCFLAHFVPRLDGGIFKRNVGCGPAGASSAEEGWIPAWAVPAPVSSRSSVAGGTAGPGWCPPHRGRGAVARPPPAAGEARPCRVSQSLSGFRPKTPQNPPSFPACEKSVKCAGFEFFFFFFFFFPPHPYTP